MSDKPEQCPHGNWNWQDCINCQVQRDLNERNMVKALRAQVAEQAAQLADWNELFMAVTMGNLPEQFRKLTNPPVKPIWPNSWHQDCAAVAFAIFHAKDLSLSTTAATFERTRQRAVEVCLARIPKDAGSQMGPHWYDEYTEAERCAAAIRNLPPEEPRNG